MKRWLLLLLSAVALAARGDGVTVPATANLTASDFGNQGTTTTVLHGNAAGSLAFGAVVQADVTNGYVDQTTNQATIAGNKTFTGNVTVSGTFTGAPASEHDFCAYQAQSALGSGTAFAQSGATSASTLTAFSSMVHDVAGSGTGTFVVKLCSDGVTCAAGNVYLTCTAGANCATAAAGRIDACTLTKTAVPANTTLTWSVGTACGTLDPGVNVCAHLTTP